MFAVEMYARVRRACMVEGMSVREASRVFGLHRDTVRKMLAYSVPPGYRRQDPPRRPKLAPFTGVIDGILEADHRVSRVNHICRFGVNYFCRFTSSAWPRCWAASVR